ncbi:MAG: glycosyltransferase [Flavobacterium sp.]|nr:MAG: glycosyltransferase [Flavobacterium sp.]
MLDRTPTLPPSISPVVSPNRPMWSVMIPCYNCIKFLEYAMRSVLIQTWYRHDIQIEVVDDASTDGDVESLVATVGKGRISYFRNEQNIGSLRTFEVCINRSRGTLIHILHGDDGVKFGFYEEIESLFESYPDIGAAITQHSFIDTDGNETANKNIIRNEPGIIQNWLYKIAAKPLVQPPAVVVKRSVYEQLGGFFAVHYGEDWEMWTRIASQYALAYSPKCLALYRGGNEESISGRFVRDGSNFNDINRVLEIIQAYIPDNKKKEIRKLAKRNFSISYANSAFQILKKNRNNNTAFILAKGALALDINLRTVYYIIRAIFQYFIMAAFDTMKAIKN